MLFFFFQAEDGIRDLTVTGVQTCALPIYKDEYEVARLHTDAAFSQRIAGMFEGDYRVVHHLAPPSSAGKDEHGHLVKKSYGPWMRKAMEVLAKMKGLRGTALDPFGRTEERRTERALDRKSTRLNSSHSQISYAVFCLKKKN